MGCGSLVMSCARPVASSVLHVAICQQVAPSHLQPPRADHGHDKHDSRKPRQEKPHEADRW